MNAGKSSWWIGGGVVAAILIFQLFFRYGYVSTGTSQVWRVDRLTGGSCALPCLSAPGPASPKTLPRVAMQSTPQSAPPPARAVETPVRKAAGVIPPRPNALGFWTNIDGASDGHPYARGLIRVRGTLVKGSTGVNAGFFVGDNGGTSGTGYFVYLQTNGNFAITKFLNGVSQGDVQSHRAKNDKKPHTIALTIRTSGSINAINATFDNVAIGGSDNTLVLPDPSYVTVYTGGSTGTLARYEASGATSSPTNVPSMGTSMAPSVGKPVHKTLPRKLSPTSSP